MRYSWLAEAPLAVGVAVLVGASACSSGQTGSLDCAEPERPCVCTSLEDRAQYRAEIIALDPDAGQVTLHLTDQLTEATNASPPSEGAALQGGYGAGPPCAPTPQPTLAIGDEVFVAHDARRTIPLWLAPWGKPIAFGDDLSLAPHELAELADAQTCRALHSGPAHECNDTYSPSSCSVHARQTASSAWSALGASAVLVLAATWLRRRRARTRRASLEPD